MLTSRILKVEGLGLAEKQEMFRLLDAHYDHCNWERFLGDLREKTGVILLFKPSGEIRGFSSFGFWEQSYQGEQLVLLFSGDTIIHKQQWGNPLLFKSFAGLLADTLLTLENRRFFWLLISKGIRTYLLLPLFFKRFFPAHDHRTPPAEKNLLDQLAQEKFGTAYNPMTGIIRSQGDCLKEELTDISPKRQRQADVRYFLKSNPGWKQGDELACLAEIKAENFKPTALRLMPDQLSPA